MHLSGDPVATVTGNSIEEQHECSYHDSVRIIARCRSGRVSGPGVMVRKIDPSWWTN